MTDWDSTDKLKQSIDWHGMAWQVCLEGKFKDFEPKEDKKLKAAYEAHKQTG